MAQSISNGAIARAVKYTSLKNITFKGNTLRVSLGSSIARQLQAPSKAGAKLDKIG